VAQLTVGDHHLCREQRLLEKFSGAERKWTIEEGVFNVLVEMKKIFTRQKDGGKGSTKITPLTLDMPPQAQHQHQHQTKRSPEGPMQFARHSATDEPDPWVLVSGAPASKPNAETIGPHFPQQAQRRRSSSTGDFSLLNPRSVLDPRPPPHSVLPAGASPPVPGNNNVLGLPPPATAVLTPTTNDREKEHRGLVKRKIGYNPASKLRALDPRASDRSNDSPQLSPSPVPQQTREEPVRGDRDSERRKVSAQSDKKERPRERDRDRHGDDDAYGDVSLRSMIGKFHISFHTR
jgi:hypothetical protein